MIQVATWNVNSVRARLPHLLDWLSKRCPDIVLLQETKVEDHLFPTEPLEDRGYNVSCFGQKSYNGVAVLSKFPVEEVIRGLPALEPSSEARYLEVVTGGLRVASVYVPNGREVGHEKYHFKHLFFKALQERVRELLTYEEVFILGGDYNVAPADTDVYDPDKWHERILCSTDERRWFRSLLHLGLKDPLAGTEGLFTWWDYRNQGFNRNAGLRIDHLLLSAEAGDILSAISVDQEERGRERASDHAPVWGRFDVA